jgi:uncharacterized membrane protein (GlpM family)
MDLLLRFLIGGAVVSLFSLWGDVLKPKSLGGVFAGGPTIALATICLTAHKSGAHYVAIEGRSMIAGALAFFAYACVVSFVLMRYRPSTLKCASLAMPLWAVVAFAIWAIWLR